MTTAGQQIARNANANNNINVWGSIIYNVKAYGAKGNNANDDTTSLAATIALAAAAGGIVFFPSGTYITGNLTIPSNVTLWFTNGSKLSINSGANVTINGPIDAGIYQIFSGNGTVLGKPLVDKFYPQWWGAKGDGITDDTTAIQKTIDVASTTGGVVYFPSSSSGYLVTGNLIVLPFTHLTGGMSFVGDKSNNRVLDTGAATLLFTGGAGNESGTAAIEIRNGCQISNLKFFYPNQTNTNPPVQYPPTIKLSNNFSNDVILENLFFTNSWIAIDASGGHERMTIRNVRGQPLKRGIIVDNNFDVDRIEEVHFYPYWSDNITITTSAAAWQAQNGTAIEIFRADSIQLNHIFAYNFRYGLNLRFGPAGGSYGSLDTGGLDFCHRGISAENQGINGTAGWSISNVGFAIANQYLANAYGINTLGTVNGSLRVTNSSFWIGTNGQINAVLNSGDTMFVNCHFKAWAASNPSVYIDGAAGTQFGTCLFDPVPSGGVHVTLASGATVNSIITGTRFKGGKALSDGSATASFVESGNVP